MEIKTLTLDGTEYEVEKLGPAVQNLLRIRSVWAGDLQKEQLAVAKSETAIKALDLEIVAQAKAAIEAAAPQAANQETPAA